MAAQHMDITTLKRVRGLGVRDGRGDDFTQTVQYALMRMDLNMDFSVYTPLPRKRAVFDVRI
jgi:hypothetical protein